MRKGIIRTSGLPGRQARREMYKGIPFAHEVAMRAVIEYGCPAEYSLNDLRDMYLLTKPEERCAVIEGYRKMVADIQAGELEPDKRKS